MTVVIKQNPQRCGLKRHKRAMSSGAVRARGGKPVGSDQPLERSVGRTSALTNLMLTSTTGGDRDGGTPA